MPYFINESTDPKPVYQQIKDLKLWRDSRVVTINPVPNDWSDAQVIKYLEQEKIRERNIRVLFVLSYHSYAAADICYKLAQFEEKEESETVTRAKYDFFLRTSIKKFRHSMPDIYTKFHILLDPPLTTNVTLTAFPAPQPESEVVPVPAEKESQTLTQDNFQFICCKEVMRQITQKLPIILLIHTHPLQKAFKTLLIVGWSVSALADPQGEKPLTLLSLLPAGLAFFYFYRSIALQRARHVLLADQPYGNSFSGEYGDVRRVSRVLFESLQVSLMAYALFTRAALSPCLSVEEGLPLPQVPQEYFIPLFLSVFLGFVRMSSLLGSKLEFSHNVRDTNWYWRAVQRHPGNVAYGLLKILLHLPLPYVFDALSIGTYLLPALESLIPFFAVYCVSKNLMPDMGGLILAGMAAAAHMVFERESFYSSYPKGKKLAFYLSYAVRWLLDAVTHIMAAVIGFVLDPFIAMGMLKVIGKACVGWMMGEFSHIYLSPYVQGNGLYALPYVMAATGLAAGITELISRFFKTDDQTMDPVYTGTLQRYQLFFSKHTGDIVDAFYLRYLEHALSVGKWINDVTKATGKMLGCYRPKQGVGFFCCDGSGASASEATVVMMDDPVGPTVDYGTRTPSSSQKEEAVTKPPRSYKDFFIAGAKELGALCGKRELPVAAR